MRCVVSFRETQQDVLYVRCASTRGKKSVLRQKHFIKASFAGFRKVWCMGMNCIYCGGDTSVENSRPKKRSNTVWRRRECKDCSTIFTSSEALDLSGSILVYTGSHSEPFNRDKLFTSIHDSLKHRKSPVYDATALTDTIINKVVTIITNPKLDTSIIRDICHDTLQKYDSVAATHYAAFH